VDDVGVLLDRGNLPALARGCAALGAGGGGDPTLPLLMAQRAVEQHGAVNVVDVSELGLEDVVLPCGMRGAPTIAEERIWNGGEGRTLCEAIERVRGQAVDALMAFHIAGAGGLLAVTWAARGGLPILDADGMGRVFPGLNQQTMGLAGIPPSPLVLTDGRGNTLLLHPADDAWAERLAAGALATLGGVCAAAVYCMTGEQARRATIPGSVSLALRLGRAMETEPLSARMSSVCHVLGGLALIEGRMHDVHRRVDGGLVHGSATVVGTGSDAGRRVRLEFQSEFLLALEDGAAAAAVPELISVLRSDTCVPIATERLQQGQRVTVLASPALEPWRSDEGMTMVGPAAFGYDVELDSRRGEHLDA
jgi:DUF917 family protein